jgi:hypothetical protein
MLCLKLTEAGFVAVASNGTRAGVCHWLKEIKIAPVDLLIVNLAVPGTTDLIQLLHAENERLKIIAIDDPRAVPSLQPPSKVSYASLPESSDPPSVNGSKL